MMKTRSIDKVVYAVYRNMGELWVRQPIPSETLEYLDPFILLHHGHIVTDPEQDLKLAGVGPHPHRGFSPVTFVFKGGTHHRDSRGNDHIVYSGGTQWMHAGMGIIHSERPVAHEMEIIQLWINTPAAHKMDQPYYFPLSDADTPKYSSADGRAVVSVIAGELVGIKGPVPVLSPVIAAMMVLKEGAELSLEIPVNHNLFMYLLDGSIEFSGTEVSGLHLVSFDRDGEGINLRANSETRAVLLSGEPTGETIVAKGPFVMNSDTQIMEAMRDYRMGKMGFLVEE